MPYDSLVHTISGTSKLIEGSSITKIELPNGTHLIIEDTLYSLRSHKTLPSFKDIGKNNYHLETGNKYDHKFLYAATQVHGQKTILERFKRIPLGLYIMKICQVETNLTEH